MLFKKLHSKLRLTEESKPKKIEDRVKKVEEDVRELRSALRDLVSILEKTLSKDIDQDGGIGTTAPKRALPKTARLDPPLSMRKTRGRSRTLPNAYP